MALKEKAELICPPQYAYGDDGVPPYVPPSETQRNRSAKHLPKREPRSRSSMKRRRLKQLRIQKGRNVRSLMQRNLILMVLCLRASTPP